MSTGCGCTNILVATFSSYVLGGLWYSPLLFFNAWKKASGDPNIGDESAHSPWTFAFAFLMNLMTVVCLDHYIPKNATMEDAVTTSLMFGVFLIFSSFGTTYAFSDKKMMLLLIDSLYHVVKLVLFAVILVGLK